MFSKILPFQLLLVLLLLQKQRVDGHARLIYSCTTTDGTTDLIRIFVHFSHILFGTPNPNILGKLVIDGVPTFPNAIVDGVFDPVTQFPDLGLCEGPVIEDACCEDETIGGCTPIGIFGGGLGWAYFDVVVDPDSDCLIELSDTLDDGTCIQCDPDDFPSSQNALNGACLAFADGEPYGPPLYPTIIACIPSASPSVSPTISIAPSTLPSVSPSTSPTTTIAPSTSPSTLPTTSIPPSSSPSFLGECDGCVFMNQVLGDPVDSALTVQDDFCRMKLFPILIEGESGSCNGNDSPAGRCEESGCTMEVTIRFQIGNSDCFGSCELILYDELAGQFLIIDSVAKPQAVQYSKTLPCTCDSRRLKVVFSCNPKAGNGLQTVSHSAIYTCSECTLYPF